ncbi:ATP-binding protein [Streptomyces sp. NPDC005805]|uniref:ATP-binding protein n=1 Tax=Streptomyces sp. NPDC005805 TaxID=3157068 RepID=UPI0033DB1180
MTTTASPPTAAQHTAALACDPCAPAVARRLVARWLGADDGPANRVRTTDAVLIVSELVTNAVRHTRGPCVLSLTARDELLDIAVADHSEELPEVDRTRGGDERGGFGLEIVRRLGGRITVVPRLGGKTVHVLLDGAADPGGARSPR